MDARVSGVYGEASRRNSRSCQPDRRALRLAPRLALNWRHLCAGWSAREKTTAPAREAGREMRVICGGAPATLNTLITLLAAPDSAAPGRHVPCASAVRAGC